jgi:hypothetical protein
VGLPTKDVTKAFLCSSGIGVAVAVHALRPVGLDRPAIVVERFLKKAGRKGFPAGILSKRAQKGGKE